MRPWAKAGGRAAGQLVAQSGDRVGPQLLTHHSFLGPQLLSLHSFGSLLASYAEPVWRQLRKYLEKSQSAENHFVALYGTWAALGGCKILPWGVGTICRCFLMFKHRGTSRFYRYMDMDKLIYGHRIQNLVFGLEVGIEFKI